MISTPAALLLLTSLSGSSDTWLSFDRDDDRLRANGPVGAADMQEKDYAVGDFDRDGRTDLVCVRKKPLDNVGGRRNVLFMNEDGDLVDRTAQFGSASDVPGDTGLLERTNDRDVVAVDVDLDGWLDLVTATTLSPNDPKEISHPRVYRNLGSSGGVWLGFRYEAARFPQLLLDGGAPSWPRFTSVTAGDVTGDGYPDLYFGDNDKKPNQGGGDMQERLLVNDGTGTFVDESGPRLGAANLVSIYTTSVTIADVNGDGAQDIVRNRGYFEQPSIAYNDPNNPGFFTSFQVLNQVSPYFTSVGDLNRDDRLDLIFSENAEDSVRFHPGGSTSGQVAWTPRQPFEYAIGGDDGFGADNYAVDLDLDGWTDVLICDFDIELPGCDRYLHLYRNQGGKVGQPVVLREEAEAGGAGWKGAAGLYPDDLRGVHDTALLDLDLDGDLDLVVGRCDGTSVYLNATVPNGPVVGMPYCECVMALAPCANGGGQGLGCANSAGEGASLVAHGSNDVSADDLTVTSLGLSSAQPAMLFVATTPVGGGMGAPYGDGLLCAEGGMVSLGVQPSTLTGSATFGPNLGVLGGWQPGDTRYFQVAYRDPAGPCGMYFNLSSAISVTFR